MSKDSQTVQVSFNSKTRDTRLFIYVESCEEKSKFVKNAIEFYIKHLDQGEWNARAE